MKFTLIALLASATAVMAQDTVSATRSGVCEPHDDHWHCPSGVPKPTYPPNAIPATTPIAASASAVISGSTVVTPSAKASSHSHGDDDDDHDHAATASTCEPHGDHWHCPSGVAQPSTRPAAAVSGSASARTTPTRATTGSAVVSSSAAAFPGAAGKVSGVQGAVLAVAGAVGALVL